MTLYTRRGDTGETGLGDGSRTSKASARVEAFGTLDELGASLGFARQAIEDERIDAMVRFVQQRLFNCASTLANPAAQDAPVSEADVAFLEAAIDALSAAPAEWRGFTLASGGEAATRLQLARTIARRAERRVVALAAEAPVDATLLAFLNRISDLLFAAARAAAVDSDLTEDLWDKDAEPPSL